MRSSIATVIVLALTLFVIGCTQMGQSPSGQSVMPTAPTSTPSVNAAALNVSTVETVKPGYEPAYYNGTTVTINAIEVPQNTGPLTHAAADFYETVYPPNKALWPDTPQCNPCDHEGNGIDFTDFHNHVLDSIPSNPGGGEYNPLWHVFVIVPASLTPAGQAAYAARLPMKSEAAIDAAIAAGVATEVDTGFYFICAVVNAHASGK